MGFRRRQVITSLLAANTFRAVPTYWASIPTMFGGWLTAELAPQLAVLTAADTAREMLRKDKDKLAIGLGLANTAVLGAMVADARSVEARAETALTDALGADYHDRMPPGPADHEPVAPLSLLARPFRMARPDVEVIRNIPYNDNGTRGLLDVYRPASGAVEGAPVLLQVHGGGWTIGNKDQQGLLIMNRMAAQGWVCAAINYRLSPKHKWPAHIVDVKRAIAWIRENISGYGGDPGFLAITGGSAGGHLSALAALTPNDPAFQPGFEEADTRVQAAVPFYGVYDMAGETSEKARKMRDTFLATRVFGIDPIEHLDTYRAASPLNRIGPDAPPFFVIHGDQDVLAPVEQARSLVKGLREVSSRPVGYLEIPRTQHAFEVFTSVRSLYVIRAADRFLRTVYADSLTGAE